MVALATTVAHLVVISQIDPTHVPEVHPDYIIAPNEDNNDYPTYCTPGHVASRVRRSPDDVPSIAATLRAPQPVDNARHCCGEQIVLAASETSLPLTCPWGQRA